MSENSLVIIKRFYQEKKMKKGIIVQVQSRLYLRPMFLAVITLSTWYTTIITLCTFQF